MECNQYHLSSDALNHPWNVFLSFRGDDTRKNFTGHLCMALKQAGIRTFMDDSGLQTGEDIPDQLLKAIRGSEISLVVFSSSYASSSWCLNELVEILDCKHRMGQLVYLVFYNVSPSVVRNRSESFAAAFGIHEKRYVSNMYKVDRWKAALTESANLSGYDLQNDADGYEVRLIQIIVKKVLLEVNLVGLHVAKEPVGIGPRVEELIQLLSISSNDIRKIGIYGMGGIGKTTIAKALFNKNFRHFEGSFFLANVREASEEREGIVHLQEQLLSEILIVDKIRVENEDRGINLLMKRLRSKKVLIVLDDLSNMRQFDYLAGQWNQFAAGSRIIITTGDAGLLEQVEVDERYNVEKNELRMHDLLRDMGRDIARNNFPNEPGKHSRLWSCEDIFNVLNENKGKKCIECIIPFGGVLKNYLVSLKTSTFESIFEELRWLSWRDCPLECLPTDFCPKNLVVLDLRRSKFKILWNGPKSMEKLKILNISNCIFLTTTPDFRGVPCIEDLTLQGCTRLVEVDPSIGHLVSLVKLNLMGCVDLEGLPDSICNLTALEQLELSGCSILEGLPARLGNMKSLMLLSAENTALASLPESIGDLSKLSKLLLHSCKKLRNLPRNICNLRAVEYLDLNYCSNLNELPDNIGNMESLGMLGAAGTAITNLPESIGHLSKLSKLLLHSCKKLRYLPGSICNLTLMEVLDLNNCSDLKELPNNIGNMESLRMLLAEGTKFVKLPESIGRLSELVELVLSNCKMLKNLPDSICNIRSLKRLDLSDCLSLEGLPEDIGNITSLQGLRAWTVKYKEIPDSIRNLKNLEILDINWFLVLNYIGVASPSVFALYSLKNLNLKDCYLFHIQDSIGCLLSLQHLNLSGNHFYSLPSSLGRLINIETLTLTECKHLREIQELPPKLSDFHASYCTSIESLDVSKLDHLRFLYLSYCSSLVKIAGLDKLASIKRIDMAGCEKLSITFEKSLFQFLSGTGGRIDIHLPMRDIPRWFMNQVSESSVMRFHGTPTVPSDSLGVIAWLNIDHATDPEPVSHSKAFTAT